MKHPRAELELPEDLERPALVVVVEADEAHEGGVSLCGGRHHALDQPLAVTNGDDVARARGVPRGLVGNEDRRRRRALGGAVRLEEAGSELWTGTAGVIEAVGPARDLELVPAEAREKLAEAERGRARQSVGLLLLVTARRDGDRQGLAQLEEPGLGKGQQD